MHREISVGSLIGPEIDRDPPPPTLCFNDCLYLSDPTSGWSRYKYDTIKMKNKESLELLRLRTLPTHPQPPRNKFLATALIGATECGAFVVEQGWFVGFYCTNSITELRLLQEFLVRRCVSHCLGRIKNISARVVFLFWLWRGRDMLYGPVLYGIWLFWLNRWIIAIDVRWMLALF